jgi:hypothetical protein
VSPHPYVEIPSATAAPGRAPGEYRLEEVPPGDYEVVCRHEPMDRREEQVPGGGVRYRTGPVLEVRRRVRVAPDAIVTLDFDVPAAKEPGDDSSARGSSGPRRQPLPGETGD